MDAIDESVFHQILAWHHFYDRSTLPTSGWSRTVCCTPPNCSGFHRIEPPHSVQSGFDKMDARKIHSTLFQYMYGKRVDKLAAVFKRHGYSIHDDNVQRTQGLVLPQSLYEEDSCRARCRPEAGGAGRRGQG